MEPVSLRDLLTWDVVVASTNYSFLGLIDISFRALQPVFLSTPIALGGLGLDPPAIGTIMSSFGILSGIFAVFFFARLTGYFGVKWVYLMGVTAAVPCFSLFPIINYLARNSIERSGVLGLEVWVAVGLQVFMVVLLCMSYSTSISKLNFLTTHPLTHPFQAQYSSSSLPPHPIRPLWGLLTDSLKYLLLSCVRSDPPWRARYIRSRSMKSTTI